MPKPGEVGNQGMQPDVDKDVVEVGMLPEVDKDVVEEGMLPEVDKGNVEEGMLPEVDKGVVEVGTFLEEVGTFLEEVVRMGMQPQEEDKQTSRVQKPQSQKLGRSGSHLAERLL